MKWLGLVFCLMICWSSTRDLQITQYDYMDDSRPVQKYNPYENKWETTTRDAPIRYNAYENEWGYHIEATPTYNPYEDKWEYVD